MSAAGWLAREEAWARRRHFVWSAALVAAAVALLTATELISRAREAAVASKIDYIGPSLRLVPTGVTSTELARFELGDRVVPERIVSVLGSELSRWLQGIEGRLLLTQHVDTIVSPIIGVSRDGGIGSLASVDTLAPSEVLLGADLARRLIKNRGDRVTLLGRSWQVAGVLAPLGTAEDLALFMPLSILQEISGATQSVNEIRLYARSHSQTREIAAKLRAKHPELDVFGNADRGNEAERQTRETLRRHRTVLYWLTGFAVAIGLMSAAYINAAERRVEMAMLVAMGSTATTVLLTLVARAALVGLVGAVVGYGLGAGIAAVQDTGAALTMVWSWVQPASVAIAAAALSMVAAVPACIHATYRDHVRVLQE